MPGGTMQPRQLSLHCLRELDYPRRIQWLNALDRTDLQFLAAYHCACMKVKQQVTAPPRQR